MIKWNGFWVHEDNIPLKRSGLYKIINISSGMCYFGISMNVARRGAAHATAATRPDGRKAPARITIALREGGLDGFTFEPLLYSLCRITDWGNDGDWLCKIESQLIDEHNSICAGYNAIVSWPPLPPFAPEILDRMSTSAKARIRTEDFERKRIAALRAPEARAKNSASKKGQPGPRRGVKLSALQTARMSEARQGQSWITNGTEDRQIALDGYSMPNGWWRGRSNVPPAKPKPKLTPEERSAKRRKAALARWARPGARELASGRPAHNKGKPCPPQQRAAISATLQGHVPWNKGKHMPEGYVHGMLGRKQSADARARMSTTKRARNQQRAAQLTLPGIPA